MQVTRHYRKLGVALWWARRKRGCNRELDLVLGFPCPFGMDGWIVPIVHGRCRVGDGRRWTETVMKRENKKQRAWGWCGAVRRGSRRARLYLCRYSDFSQDRMTSTQTETKSNTLAPDLCLSQGQPQPGWRRHTIRSGRVSLASISVRQYGQESGKSAPPIGPNRGGHSESSARCEMTWPHLRSTGPSPPTSRGSTRQREGGGMR